MKIRKTIVKTCATLMAAAMAASPVTVQAGIAPPSFDTSWWSDSFEKAIPADTVNGIAERDIEYKVPSYDWNESGEIVPGELKVRFVDGWDFGGGGRSVPAGYKKVAIDALYDWRGDDGSYSYYEIPSCGWDIDAENSNSDWETVEWNFDDFNCAGNVRMANFTVDCGGVAYPECWVVIGDIEMNVLHAEVVVPQQYDGAVHLTIYGMKNENGKLIRNEASYITVYLQGGNGSTAQPSAPAADPQPAVPAADPTADPQPAVPVADPTVDPQPAVPVTTQQQGTVYVTKSGDNLMKIAKELYGDRNLWTTIYELNKDIIKNPNVIYANMQLQLP